MKYDSHVHVFGPHTRLRSVRRYAPAHSASLEDLRQRMDEHGVEGALLVQTSFAADADELFEAQGEDPTRFRVVVSPDGLIELRTHVDEWLSRGVVGVRLNLLGRPLPDLTATDWRGLGTLLGDAGVHLELHAEGEQWTALESGVRDWPGHVVIDHVGRPTAAAPLAALGGLEHVWFKASAPYRWPDETQANSLLDEIVTRTGGCRLLWGSDWPHTQYEDVASYDGMLEFARRMPSEVMANVDANLQRLLGARHF